MHRSALSVILLKKLYFKSVMHRSALSVFFKKMLRIPELRTPISTLQYVHIHIHVNVKSGMIIVASSYLTKKPLSVSGTSFFSKI